MKSFGNLISIAGVSALLVSNALASGAPPKAPSYLWPLLDPRELIVNLDWDDRSTDEGRFEIEMSEGESEFRVVSTVASGVTSSDFWRLFPGRAYRFRVRAANEFGFSDYSPEAFVRFEPQPAEVTAENLPGGGVKISWIDTTPDEDGYWVKMMEAETFAGPTAELPADSTSIVFDDVAPGTYFIEVVAKGYRASRIGFTAQ